MRRPVIGIVFGDGALGCVVRAQRLAARLGTWADVVVQPFGGEHRDFAEDWPTRITGWARENAVCTIVDDQAMYGIIAAKRLGLGAIALIQHHPIWGSSYREAATLLALADRLVVPMWPWIGAEGIGSLGALADRAEWTGPVLPEGIETVSAEPRTLLVTAGSAKYDRTPFILGEQVARRLLDWTVTLNDTQPAPAAPPGNLRHLPTVASLGPFLQRSATVLCAGGITMLEAVAAGHVPIVLPVRYQKEQAWTAGRLHELGLARLISSGILSRDLADLVVAPAAPGDHGLDLGNGIDAIEKIVREVTP